MFFCGVCASARRLDIVSGSAYATHMNMNLPQHQIDSLAALASRVRRSPDELLVEAVDRLLADEDWFARQVQTGVEQMARGELIEEEEMDERVRRLLQA